MKTIEVYVAKVIYDILLVFINFFKDKIGGNFGWLLINVFPFKPEKKYFKIIFSFYSEK
jgi:hypothetical protein